MKKDEALKLALDALYIVNPNEFSQADPEGKIDKAIIAIKEVLAQPEQEPVAWRFLDKDPLGGKDDRWVYLDNAEFKSGVKPATFNLEPVYTSPPQRKPLTDEQISNVCVDVHLKRDFNTNLEKFVAIARAIEAAHGIKGDV